MDNAEEMLKVNFPVVPTTKILAIGQFTKPPTPEQLKEIFPKEVPATLRLYLAGKIVDSPDADRCRVPLERYLARRGALP